MLFLLPWGHVVAQLVERKQEGHRCDSPWCRDFLLTRSWLHCGCGVDSASNRNE